MIGKIELRNFKCFESLSLTCSPLTLLCGMNGTGKSSALQALLVLRQSFAAGELQEGRLVLSGGLADLGAGSDVLFEEAETDAMEIQLHRDDAPTPCSFSFDYRRGADELRTRSAVPAAGQGPEMLAWWGEVPPLGGNLIHVDAGRMSRRKVVDSPETSSRFGHPGALNHFHARQEETLPSFDPRCTDLSDRRLFGAFSHWLQEVAPGARLQLEEIRDSGSILDGLTFGRPGKGNSRRGRDKNSGFGLSCALPVLAALLSPPGSLCLIENPEAHLHPLGQTKLAELAVRASLAGVQVIAETHSDHFMDGVRIAVRDGLIHPDQTAFHHFERVGGKTVVSSPQVDADGRFSSWPAGFFDQHEENLARLVAP